MENIIFHVDVNSAFLSWEAVYRVKILGDRMDLRNIPSAVGGDIKKRHGIILAKSLPSKKYNIHTGETIGDACKKCPELVVVPPHYDLYESCSKAFMNILREYSPCVEQYSVLYALWTRNHLIYGICSLNTGILSICVKKKWSNLLWE